MMKVLAAELSDPAASCAASATAADDAVVDIVMGHGAATAVVQGAARPVRRDAARARPGRSVPARRELTVRCTCPDDDALGGGACKHAVAALFALADEVASTSTCWRGGARPTACADRRPEGRHRRTRHSARDEPPATGRPAHRRDHRPAPSAAAGPTPGPARADGARRGGHPRPSGRRRPRRRARSPAGALGLRLRPVRGPEAPAGLRTVSRTLPTVSATSRPLSRR